MLNRKQIWALLALTLMWGVNWPMMKLSLQETTPLMFRASTMLLGARLAVFLRGAQRRAHVARAGREWAAIALLALPNVLGWHTLSIFGVQELASGRAAILGFTMPIFTVLLGAAFFGERITPRVRVAVVCASLAIALLLWHELARLSGRPAGIAWMLGAAVCWALGTLMFRRSQLTLSPLVITVWMLLLGSVVVWALALALEPLPDTAAFFHAHVDQPGLRRGDQLRFCPADLVRHGAQPAACHQRHEHHGHSAGGHAQRHRDRGRNAPLARLAGHGLCDDGHRQRAVARAIAQPPIAAQ